MYRQFNYKCLYMSSYYNMKHRILKLLFW